MSELKPCPFCGGKPMLWRARKTAFDNDALRQVICDCGYQNQFYTDAEAIAAWNRRPDAPSADTGEVGRELNEWKSTAAMFCALWADRYARDCGLPEGHLHPTHYDILKASGARVVDFTRASLPAPPQADGGEG